MIRIFNSIRLKLTLWYVVTVGILILAFVFALYLSLRVSLEKSVDISLRTFEEELKDALQRNAYQKWKKVINKESGEEIPIDIMYVQILRIGVSDKKPHIFVKSEALKSKTLPISEKAYNTALKNGISFETIEDFHKHSLRIMTSLIKSRWGTPFVLQIGTPLKGIFNALGKFLVILLVSVPILLILSAFGGYFFVKRAFFPVKKIVKTVKRITAENLSHRVEPINSKDEIGELAETFNDMISRLEKSFEHIKQFSSDVSHELKTPLTAVKGEIEVTLRRNRKKDEYKKTLKSLLEDIDKLEEIIENLFLLSRMDSENLKFLPKKFALEETLLEAFEDMETIAKKKKVHLILKNIQEMEMKGESTLIKRVFTNLINNAIKYTPEGGKIEISLKKAGGFAKFIVQDTGIGIPQEEIPHIFDRFYRVEKARSREAGGSGLGLAIVKWIVEAHKGKIEVTSEAGEGSIFIVSFPF